LQGPLSLVPSERRHTTPQPFYGPFSGTTRVSLCQKRTSGLYGAMVQGEINRSSGWAPLHPDQPVPTSTILPYFYGRPM